MLADTHLHRNSDEIVSSHDDDDEHNHNHHHVMDDTDCPDNVPVEVQAEVYGTTRMRFFVVGIFAAFGFANQVQYVAFSTIVRATQERYKVNALEVNLLSLFIPLIYVLTVYPGCWLYSRIGLRHGMISGAGINAVAGVLKLISVWVPNYALLAVSQVLVGFAQVLFLSLPPMIAATWFPIPERSVATAVATLFGFAGMAVGMFYSPRIVFLPDHSTNRQWGILMGSQFALALLVFLLMAAIVPEKPQLKPSMTAAKEAYSIWTSTRRQLKNKNGMLLVVCFGVITGFLTAIAALLTQILEPFEITERIAGVLAFSGILAGSANCAVLGFIVDCYRRYKISMLILSVIVLVLMVILLVLLEAAPLASAQVGAYIIVPLLETLVLPVVPVAMEFSVELTYPDPETVSSTMQLASLCLFSFIGMIVFSIILGDHPTKKQSCSVFIVVISLVAVSTFALLFVKEDRKRLKMELLESSLPSTTADGQDEEEDLSTEGAIADVYAGDAITNNNNNSFKKKDRAECEPVTANVLVADV